MGKRIVSAVFLQYTDAKGGQRSAPRGAEVELSAEDEARLDDLGALEEKGAEPAVAAPGPEDPGVPPSSEDFTEEDDEDADEDDKEPVDVDNIDVADLDALTVDEIETALDELGVDYSTGGSLKDGSFNATEKRDALKDALQG